MTNESGLREKIARAIGSLEREPLAAITSLDGTVKEPLICLTVSERDAILALISPAGEVVVPVEPTPEMIEAGYPDANWTRDDCPDQARKSAAKCWAAMLSAAPRGMEG